MPDDLILLIWGVVVFFWPVSCLISAIVQVSDEERKRREGALNYIPPPERKKKWTRRNS